ncbi:uncharacterized protein [Cherax quadricarinatus]|uniref:uncharacterized protein n=1 Tax=Cherax quadricarinatus TaxID=27406 RepID=UPI00387E5AC9
MNRSHMTVVLCIFMVWATVIHPTTADDSDRVGLSSLPGCSTLSTDCKATPQHLCCVLGFHKHGKRSAPVAYKERVTFSRQRKYTPSLEGSLPNQRTSTRDGQWSPAPSR